jgi:hypothetical protein
MFQRSPYNKYKNKIKDRETQYTMYQRRDGQCTVQIIVIGRGTMSVDGLVFVEISQIQSHYRRPTKTFEDPGASLPFGLGKCECECYKQMPGMCSQSFQFLPARCSVVRDSREPRSSHSFIKVSQANDPCMHIA